MYQIQYISSALRPDVAGINPILLDVRVIHDTINIIRELSQVVILDDILLALGLSKQRMQQFVAGDSLNDDEISNNIAFLTFLSTQSIQNIFGNKARLLNEAFCDICLVQMVLPIPVEIFKPKDPNIKIPYTIGEKIQRRAESDQSRFCLNSLIFERGSIIETKNELIREARINIIKRCKQNSTNQNHVNVTQKQNPTENISNSIRNRLFDKADTLMVLGLFGIKTCRMLLYGDELKLDGDLIDFQVTQTYINEFKEVSLNLYDCQNPSSRIAWEVQ